MSSSPHDQALSYISNPLFHQEFTLPATADHDALTVSYADVGRVPETPAASPGTPTILMIQGMFATRYLGVWLHAIALKLAVRVLVVDRPGMGRSTDVPLQRRVSTWVELVPRLLAHLGISHVALVSHSAGTIYLLNTLHHCRDILHPKKPFVVLMAPWVDPLHSKVTSMQMAQYVPVRAFGVWNHIPRFFLLDAQPALASSGAVVGKLTNMVSSTFGSGVGGNSSNQSQDAATGSQKEKNRSRLATEYGLPRDVQLELDTLVFKSMFAESTVGANSEALQCLRKGPGWTWGECGDYAAFVKAFVQLERGRREAVPNTGVHERLKVRAYFAESDAMIGELGQHYVEKCWRGPEDEQFHNVIDFDTTTVAGVDHDSLTQSVEVLEKILVYAAGMRECVEPDVVSFSSG